MIEGLTTEFLTALGVSSGALLGGVAALIGELRKPIPGKGEASALSALDTAGSEALLEAEVEYLSRTMWIIERRLSDQLLRIEAKLGASATPPMPGPGLSSDDPVRRARPGPRDV